MFQIFSVCHGNAAAAHRIAELSVDGHVQQVGNVMKP